MLSRAASEHAPPATVDGERWETSVWRDRAHGTLLPVPKRMRKGREAGDVLTVELSVRVPF